MNRGKAGQGVGSFEGHRCPAANFEKSQQLSADDGFGIGRTVCVRVATCRTVNGARPVLA